MDVSDRFPNATIWLTGHSLGGAVASLIGQTFGVPAVTFESPGDRLAAQRLHLPRAPGAADLPIWHFGHTADPIYIGVCTVSIIYGIVMLFSPLMQLFLRVPQAVVSMLGLPWRLDVILER